MDDTTPGWSTSSHDGQNWSEHMVITCPEHGQVGFGPRDDLDSVAMDMLRVHREVFHDGQPHEFTMEPAGMRCDVCGIASEPPWWSHHAYEPINGAGVIDHDQKWLLCQDCHGFFVRKQRLAWRDHCVAQANLMAPWVQQQQGGPAVDPKQFYTAQIGKMLKYLDPGHQITASDQH